MSSSKKLLQSASGFIDQSSGGTVVDDVFTVHLYEGNGSNGSTNLLEIEHGINLKDYEGFMLMKNRENANSAWHIYDTIRGVNRSLNPSHTYAESYITSNPSIYGITEFDTFRSKLGSSISGENINHEAGLAWVFRKHEKFVTIVTWTGDGSANRTISHDLGQVPGMIWAKNRSVTSNWHALHRSVPVTGSGNSSEGAMLLNDAGGSDSAAWMFQATYPTATNFTVAHVSGASYQTLNENGHNYIAYIFGHDTDDDGFIQCGQFTVPGGNDIKGTEIDLGWQPQAIIYKRFENSAGNKSQGGAWYIQDTMRGWAMAPLNASGKAGQLQNANGIDSNVSNGLYVGTKGFGVPNSGYFGHGSDGDKFLYMAIRNRGMRVPNYGTQVHKSSYYGSSQAQALHPKHLGYTGNVWDYVASSPPTFNEWAVDWFLELQDYSTDKEWRTRLMGRNNYFKGQSTNPSPAVVLSSTDCFGSNRGIYPETGSVSQQTYKKWHYFRIGKKVFDMGAYCHTRSGESSMNVVGTGGSWTDTSSTEAMYGGTRIRHNLGVVPEMLFIKRLYLNNAPYGGSDDMYVWHKDQKAIYSGSNTGLDTVYETRMNNAEHHGYNVIDHTTTGAMTDEHFVVSSNYAVNALNASTGSRYWYHYWAWASLPGISKVGSFTGDTTNGVTVTCGFQPRFIMMENSNPTSAGNSYFVVFSSLNGFDTGASSQSYDIFYPMVGYGRVIDHNAFTITSTGFNMTADTNYPQIHENGKRHIFLAIA